MQRFYLRTSRQLRLLGIEAKAPLYSFFTDSVAGAVTIRAFRWQSNYQKRACRLINSFLQAEYLLSCVQVWLAFVLDTIVAVLAITVVSIVITLHDKFDPGSVGVSLVKVIGFSTTLMRVIKGWTQMESSIGAVARLKQFVEQTETECTIDEDRNLDFGWPQTGLLQIENLEASHR